MPSGINHDRLACAAQSYTLIVGKWLHAAKRAEFNTCMLSSEYGQVPRRVIVAIHNTGWWPMIDIIRAIRVAKLIVEPVCTLSTSLVPRARIQQPRKPCEIWPWATVAALGWPSNVSTIDRAPEI